MTNSEFSNTFTELLNSYSNIIPLGSQTPISNIVLDEYEKSVFLTKAQEDVVLSLYTGNNVLGGAFETTEEMRRYLDCLVVTKQYEKTDAISKDIKLTTKSLLFQLPSNLAFITLEEVKYDDESLGCFNGSTVSVYPVTQDEYTIIKENPYRGPGKHRVIRLDAGNNIVELISKYEIGSYLIRYLKRPNPIILEDLPDDLSIDGITEETPCELNDMIHGTILNRAVVLALQSRGISTER